MSRFQKIILIAGFGLVVAVLGYTLYILFFRPLVPGTNNENVNGAPVNGLPSANEGGNFNINAGTNATLGNLANGNANADQPGVPTDVSPGATVKLSASLPVTESPSFSPKLGTDGFTIQYYDRATGKFYTVDENGNIRAMSDRTFYQVSSVAWSPQGDKAVLEYPDGSNIIYDFTTSQQKTLPSHWEDFSFSPDGGKIIGKSIGLSEENRFLVITDSEASKSKIVRELGNNADQVVPNWSPNNQMVGFYIGDLDIDRQEIYFIGQNNENFKSMVVEGWGFSGQWSPQGDRILYSVYSSESDNKPELWIVDATQNSIGSNRKNIRIQTWSDKCTFYDNTSIYCAVPSRLEPGAGLVPESADNSPDTIYKINIQTGSRTPVVGSTDNHTMENLMVSRDGNSLFYTNKLDGRLYKIPLQ